MQLPFIKMNGAGNDFVIVDARTQVIALTPEQIQSIASRENTLTQGCDQLIVMEPSKTADVFMRIYNQDASEVDACGNATRCIGWLMMQESKKSQVTVETKVARLVCEQGKEPNHVIANMGKARTLKELAILERNATFVDMGNPHIVFFVEEKEAINQIEEMGLSLQTHPAFLPSHGVNVSIAFVSENAISMRVWERGVGLTQSCGTAACAVVVAALYQQLLADNQQFHTLSIEGNIPQTLQVCVTAEKEVLLCGAVEEEFRGCYVY